MSKKQTNPNNASGPSKPVSRDGVGKANPDTQIACKHDRQLAQLDNKTQQQHFGRKGKD